MTQEFALLLIGTSLCVLSGIIALFNHWFLDEPMFKDMLFAICIIMAMLGAVVFAGSIMSYVQLLPSIRKGV